MCLFPCSNDFVRADKVLELRELLDKLSSTAGLVNEEKGWLRQFFVKLLFDWLSLCFYSIKLKVPVLEKSTYSFQNL